MKSLVIAFALFLATPLSPASKQAPGMQGAPRRFKIILSVEAEGHGWPLTQIGKDLSPADLAALRSQIAQEIVALPNHFLVPADEKGDCLGFEVTAEKLEVGRESFVLVSSVLTIAKADQKTDVLVTHDVIAEPSVGLAGHAVVGQLVGMETLAPVGGHP